MAVDSVASSLFSMGIRKGHVILLLSPNSIFFPIVCLSVMSLGAIITTTNPLNTTREIAKQIADSNHRRTPIIISISISIFISNQLHRAPLVVAAARTLQVVHADECPICRDGNSLFNITQPGEFYFTSGVLGHCDNTQKLHISVFGNGSSSTFSLSYAPAASPSYPTVFGSIPMAPSSSGLPRSHHNHMDDGCSSLLRSCLAALCCCF